MILRENMVDTETGQTYFSGERVAVHNVCRIQRPMTWLSEHQIQLRIEKEHILSQHKSSIGTSGDIKP